MDIADNPDNGRAIFEAGGEINVAPDLGVGVPQRYVDPGGSLKGAAAAGAVSTGHATVSPSDQSKGD